MDYLGMSEGVHSSLQFAQLQQPLSLCEELGTVVLSSTKATLASSDLLVFSPLENR